MSSFTSLVFQRPSSRTSSFLWWTQLCQLCQGKGLVSNFVVEEWLVTIFLLLLMSRLMTTSEKDSSIWPRVAHKAYFLVFKKIFQGEGKLYICNRDGNTISLKKEKKKDIGAWEEAIGLHCSNSFQLGLVLGSLARSAWTSVDSSPLKLAYTYFFPSILFKEISVNWRTDTMTVDVFIIVCTFM